jgi:phosphoribosyl-dephospho-CoA transferase
MCSAFSNLQVHDLVKLVSWEVGGGYLAKPSWVDPVIVGSPWAVVRREPVSDNLLAVGVRGAGRQQRWGTLVRRNHVSLVLRPQQLRTSLVPEERSYMPAFQALRFVEAVLPSELEWGPGGSVGFELASGIPVVTMQSDLDLVMRSLVPFDRDSARFLWRQIATAPAKVDVLVETGRGGFWLQEYALGESNRVLVRTDQGPMLTDDPWGIFRRRE